MSRVPADCISPPAAAVAMALIVFLMPSTFSKHDHSLITRFLRRFTYSAFRRVDYMGTGLMLCASILLVLALEQAGTRYPWKSSAILSPLFISMFCWLSFVQCELRIDTDRTDEEPIFPMRLLKDRVVAGMILFVDCFIIL